MRRFLVRSGLVAAMATLCWPAAASAHAVTTGMGPYYDGIAHFLLTPEDTVAAVALALYAGLRGAKTGRRMMFLLPLAWFIGGLVGDAAGIPFPVPTPALSFLVVGVLAAADLKLPTRVVVSIAVVVGAVHGYANGAAMRDGAGALGLLGIVSILFVVVALLAAFVVSLQRPWARIGVRVVGSWIAASGLLLLGWAFRPS